MPAAAPVREIAATVVSTADDRAAEAAARATPDVSAETSEPESSGSSDHLDYLQELGDRIVTLAAHLQAGDRQLLTLVAEFDREEGWKVGGFRSCAHWLAFQIGIHLGPAREKVRAAHALEELPLIGDAMARGELSFSKVRALTRVAKPDTEKDLLELARSATAGEVERLIRAWKVHDRMDEQEIERVRHRSRKLSVFPGDDGMYVVKGRLDPEVGALLMRAVEAASDALYRREVEEDVTPKQRRADALCLLAERALAAGFEGDQAPVSGTRAERYQVVLHVDPATLSADDEPGRSELEDGTRVSAETSRRLACDSSVVELAKGDGGTVLDVGRRTRSVPPAIRRALEARDRGCRFPGCGLRFTDAHHIHHWADGGTTRLDNLILLCRFHHRLVHEEGFRVELPDWEGGRPNFYDPRGVPLPDAPPATRVASDGATTRSETFADPSAPLVHRNRLRGVDPGPLSGRPRYRRADDIPLEILGAAIEAVVAGCSP